RGRLQGVGVDWGARAEMNFQLVSVVLAVSGAALAFAVGVPPILVLVVGVAGFLLPRWWLNQQEGRAVRSLQLCWIRPTAYASLS
ncbi:MAG: hypothetical protein KKA73_26545, partial [Chloroflexi bacterium]|nr:hypothetical protein [Chloroflexota bacterium]